jgi:hypothetical protein
VTRIYHPTIIDLVLDELQVGISCYENSFRDESKYTLNTNFYKKKSKKSRISGELDIC